MVKVDAHRSIDISSSKNFFNTIVAARPGTACEGSAISPIQNKKQNSVVSQIASRNIEWHLRRKTKNPFVS